VKEISSQPIAEAEKDPEASEESNGDKKFFLVKN
jgi:hypothetical protein